MTFWGDLEPCSLDGLLGEEGFGGAVGDDDFGFAGPEASAVAGMAIKAIHNRTNVNLFIFLLFKHKHILNTRTTSDRETLLPFA